MSTAHNPEELHQILEQLLSLSQAILQCEADQIEQMQDLMNQREPLLSRLKATDTVDLGDSQKEAVQAMIKRVQGADRQVEDRFTQIHQSQGLALRQMRTSQQVLASYRFPYTTQPTGVENQG